MKTTDVETSKLLAEAIESNSYNYVPIGFLDNAGKFQLNTADMYFNTFYKIENEWPNITPFRCTFTMCELWDMLPEIINHEGIHYHKAVYLDACYYDSGEAALCNAVNFIDEDNILNALARLVLWCIENGHALNLPKP